MTIFIAVKECVDNYVVTCTPAPKTPASEVVVKTVTDTLAVTGGEADIAGIVIVAFFILGSGLLFLYNHLKGKERRKQ